MDFNQFKSRYERKLWEQEQYNGIRIKITDEEMYKLYLAYIVVNDLKTKRERMRLDG